MVNIALNYVLMQILLVAIVKLYVLYSTFFMAGFHDSVRHTLVLVSVLVISFFILFFIFLFFKLNVFFFM